MSEALARRVERRTRQRATNRAAILEAARRVAAKAGAGNLSLRAVAGSEAERLFNGKLIAALTAFAEAAGLAPVTDRRRQAGVVLAASCVVGLSLLGRAGRLAALSQDEQT